MYSPPPPTFDFKTDEEGHLLCPLCGFDYVHLGIPHLVYGDDAYKADGKVRGDVIMINGTCEDGCEFTLNLGFHKGFTPVWASKGHEVNLDRALHLSLLKEQDRKSS